MQNRHLAALVLGTCFLGVSLFSLTRLRRTLEEVEVAREEAMQPPLEEPPAPPAPPPRPRSPRLDAARHVRPGEEARALEAIRAVLATPADEAERAEALELVAAAYRGAYVRAAIERDRPRLEVLAREAEAECPPGRELDEIRRLWPDHRAEWADEAFAAGDGATAYRLFEAALETGGPLPRRSAELLLARWRRAREAADEAAAGEVVRLAGRVALAHQGHGGRFSQPLGEAFGREGCLARGDAERDAGSPGAAVAYYEAARFMTGRNEKGVTVVDRNYDELRAEVDERLDAVRFEVARRAIAGEATVVGLERAEQLAFEIHRESIDRARRRPNAPGREVLIARAIECWRLGMAARTGQARRKLEAADFGAAGRLCRQIVEVDSIFLFGTLCEDPAYDPWPDVPERIAREIEAEAPDGDRRRRLAALRRRLEKKEYVHPFAETAAAREMIPLVEAGLGLADLARDRERAFDRLRPVLRDHAGAPVAARIAEALRDALRRARDAGDFAALVDLAGFYVSEVGPPGSNDPFRAELRAALEDASARFGEREPLERVFLLSLLADCFAGERAGEAYRKEAFRRGLEFVAASGRSSELEARESFPSAVPGHSVLAIENGTRYHVLAFFQGPADVLVRLNPYRRGTVVLSDGSWTSAVLVTTRTVRPYRGQLELAGVFQPHAYYVGREGEKDEPERVHSIGDFRLLRAPEGAGDLEVDPASGYARRRE